MDVLKDEILNGTTTYVEPELKTKLEPEVKSEIEPEPESKPEVKPDQVEEQQEPEKSPRKPFKIFGIEFAPLNVPLRRRLETLVVLHVVTQLFFATLNCFLLIYVTFWTKYYYLGLIYITWLYYDRETPAKGGRLWNRSRTMGLWKYYASYFPITLQKTEDLDPNQNYIFGYHPHGIYGYGAFGNFATDGTGFSKLFPGITAYLVTLKMNFWIPFFRDVALSRGIVDCSKESINWLLQKNGTGNAVVIVIGGAAEALDAVPNTMKLTLKSRKGFIKLALQNGAPIVPVISFGENELFTQARHSPDSFIRKFQQQVKRLFTFTLPIFHGRGIFQYSFGVLPYRQPIHTVIGKPIKFEKNETPTKEEIDELHTKYLTSLTELFNCHKSKYAADPMLELEFQ